DIAFNESLLKETEIKYQAGTVPLSEMLNFKIRVNQAKTVLTDENYNLENSKIVLAELMGLSEAKLPENIKFSRPEDRKDTLSSIDIYLESAIANRPDLEAFRKALEIAKFNLWQRYGAFLPVISANAFWGYSRNDDGYSGRYMYRPRTQDRSFNYGLSIDWTIFSGGSRIADLREAQALLASSKENLYEQWVRVVAEVRIAYENYIRAEEQVKIQKETLELVKKTRDLVEEEYKAGTANLTRLNEAQNDLVSAEGKLVSSIIALDNAFIQLKSASGEL
ncbi:MAG TPA: TolC family protein, partial [Victivallales bacterium]|nr:TolC family protein [Victivallales bacterium]